MMSKLRIAAIACCALGASAVAPGSDVTELVQSDISIHHPGPVNMARGNKQYRVKSKTLAKGLLRAFLSDGKRWAKLLWGNATEGVAGAKVPAVAADAGCSDQDREAAMASVQKMQEDLESGMEAMLPKIMEQMGGAAMGSPFGGAPAIPFAPSSDGGKAPQQEVNVNVGDLIKVPPSCDNIVDQMSDLEWSGIGSCLMDVLNVSELCIDCIPQFGKKVQEGCASVCDSAMSDLSDSMYGQIETVQGKLEKTMSSPFGGMPSEKDMMEVAGDLQEAVSSASKKLEPCAECMAPNFVGLAGCMLGEEAAKGTEAMAKELLEALKNGDLLRVEVGGMEDEDQPAMPM